MRARYPTTHASLSLHFLHGDDAVQPTIGPSEMSTRGMNALRAKFLLRKRITNESRIASHCTSKSSWDIGSLGTRSFPENKERNEPSVNSHADCRCGPIGGGALVFQTFSTATNQKETKSWRAHARKHHLLTQTLYRC